MICPNCNKKYPNSHNFCPHCGSKKEAPGSQAKKPNLFLIAISALGVASVLFATLFIINTLRLRKTSYIALDSSYLSLIPGDTAALSATVIPDSAADKQVTYRTSDASVAKVANGVVTAVSPGEAVITVLQDDVVYDSCTVHVSHTEPDSIRFYSEVPEGKIGRTERIEAVLTPDDVSDTNVEYLLSDDSLARVNDGIIEFLAEGELTVTARHVATGLSVTQTINITPIELNSFSIHLPDTLPVGKSAKLQLSFEPSDTTDKAVTWSTSNKSVAAIEDGKLVGKKAGTATITACHTATGKKETHTVKVITVALKSLTIQSIRPQIYIGDSFSVHAEIYPAETTSTSLVWSSSNNAVLHVSGSTITAKKAGTAVLTVKDKKTGIKDSVKLTVSNITASSVILSNTSKTVNAGESFTLTASIQPSNTTDKSIIWSTSNSGIATVKNGTVKTIKAGTVKITAKTKNGKIAVCTVTVKPVPLKITNGLVVKPSGKRVAPVLIHAPSYESVYVYFKNTAKPGNSFSMLVKAGTSCEINAPLGTYKMYYASGTTWYGPDLKFGDNTAYYTSPDSFRFYSAGNYYYGTELTLYKVSNGNMTTTEISPSQFPG